LQAPCPGPGVVRDHLPDRDGGPLFPRDTLAIEKHYHHGFRYSHTTLSPSLRFSLVGRSVLWPPREQCPTVISLTHSHSCERGERSVRIREDEERGDATATQLVPNLRGTRATSSMCDRCTFQWSVPCTFDMFTGTLRIRAFFRAHDDLGSKLTIAAPTMATHSSATYRNGSVPSFRTYDPSRLILSRFLPASPIATMSVLCGEPITSRGLRANYETSRRSHFRAERIPTSPMEIK